MSCAIDVSYSQFLPGDGGQALLEKWRQVDDQYKLAGQAHSSMTSNPPADCNFAQSTKKVEYQGKFNEMAARYGKWERLIAEHKAQIDLPATRLLGVSALIRDAVNRQIAMQQPDPAELSGLLASVRDSGATLKVSSDSKISSDKKDLIEINAIFDATRAPASADLPPGAECSIRMGSFADSYAKVDILLSELDGMYRDFSNRQVKSSNINLSRCTLAQTNTLAPFGIQLTQAGEQTLKAGETLRIAITGGVPPYSISAMTAGADSISAQAKLGENGAYFFEITASAQTKPNKVAYFVGDAVGAARTFLVDVTGK